MTSPLDAKLSSALGGKTAAAFEKGLRLVTVGDLLSHYPRRYVLRGELAGLAELPEGENVTIVAEVLKVTQRDMKSRAGHLLELTITDGRGVLTLTFFNQRHRAKELRSGVRGIFAGKVTKYRDTLQLTNPDYELFDETENRTDEEMQEWIETPIPIYPATGSLPSWKIRKSIAIVLDSLPPLDDPVPDAVRKSRKLMTYSTALDRIHRPIKNADWSAARKSLRFQEAFVLQAALLQQRSRLRESQTDPRVAGALLEGFDASLPFTLTNDQKIVGDEISRDLASAVPMNRLVRARSARERRSWHCGRCSRSRNPEASRHCSPRPRCSRTSTFARLSRLSDPTSRQSCGRRSSPAGCRSPSARGRCSPRSPAVRAS